MRIVALALLALAACAHETVKAPEPTATSVAESAPAPADSAPAAAPAEPVAVPTPPPAAPAAPAERRAVQSADAPKAAGPYSVAIQAPAGRVLFVSGQIAVDPAKDRLIKGDAAKQTERAMENLKAVLEAGGSTLDDVVKTTIFLTDLSDFSKINDVYARYFKSLPPARATVQVAALSRQARVAIEAVAISRSGEGAPTAAISTTGAPKAIGPYSQGAQTGAGSLLFVSGQLPIDPATGELVPGDIAAQTERVMENLKAVLASAGASFSDVVKTNIYMVDLVNDGTKMNETYGRYFQSSFPARATVQMAALPKGARIEIEAVAVTRGSAGAVQSEQAPKSLGAYSQGRGVSPGSFLFVSGQIPIDPATGHTVLGDAGTQTDRVMKNLKAVLEAAGASFDKVVKTTIYVADMAEYAKVNEAYGRYFGKSLPAGATVQVAALPRGSRVAIECLAAL